jgi:hypothetical protein
MTPIRIGAALVVAGALSIGAAACGSGSSTDSTGSASVVKKEAGLFTKGVNLVVVNKDPQPITVAICPDEISRYAGTQYREADYSACDRAPNQPRNYLVGKTLNQGQSLAMAADTNPEAEISFPGSTEVGADGYVTVQGRYYSIRARGFNPTVGAPSITLTDPNSSDQANYVEGEVRNFNWEGVDWVGSRPGDSSDYKNLTLEVGKIGPEPTPPVCLTQQGQVRCFKPGDPTYDAICQKYGGKCPPGSWDPTCGRENGC